MKILLQLLYILNFHPMLQFSIVLLINFRDLCSYFSWLKHHKSDDELPGELEVVEETVVEKKVDEGPQKIR